MFYFKVGDALTRKEIYQIVTKSDEKPTYHLAQTGYGRVDEDLFIFVNYNFKGHADVVFPNKYDDEKNILTWYGKKETHSEQPIMRNLINGVYTPYFFGRDERESKKWNFMGIGKILKFKDGVKVIDENGEETFAMEFLIDLNNNSQEPFVYDYDSVYEKEDKSSGAEGKLLYRRHKTRERNPEIVKDKKKEFINIHGKLFCEVCEFDFEKEYGKRGSGFIECHHNIPLHEQDNIRITELSDLTLLCSNCHRMIHREQKNWLTIEELRKILN